jgi:hypothetical protein
MNVCVVRRGLERVDFLGGCLGAYSALKARGDQ